MRVVIVGREESDYAREVRDWVRDFENLTGVAVEIVNPDETNGISLCKAYDVVEYPTILALTEDGMMQQMWRGVPLPQLDAVAFYAHA